VDSRTKSLATLHRHPASQGTLHHEVNRRSVTRLEIHLRICATVSSPIIDTRHLGVERLIQSALALAIAFDPDEVQAHNKVPASRRRPVLLSSSGTPKQRTKRDLLVFVTRPLSTRSMARLETRSMDYSHVGEDTPTQFSQNAQGAVRLVPTATDSGADYRNQGHRAAATGDRRHARAGPRMILNFSGMWG